MVVFLNRDLQKPVGHKVYPAMYELVIMKCHYVLESTEDCELETCQWLKFPLNGSRAQSRVSPAVGLLPLASGLACLGMAFPFLVKQLYRRDSVVISSFLRTGYTTRR